MTSRAHLAPLLLLLLFAVMPRPVSAQGQGRRVTEISITGLRKVEDAAIRSVLSSGVGKPLNLAWVSADVRAIWAMNYFEDVKVKLVTEDKRVELIYIVKEKPALRKIIVGGNDEVDLDKINEVLDLKKSGILSVAKIKSNLEKIRDLYIGEGFYLAEVDYRLRKVSSNEVDVIFEVTENAKVMIRHITFVGNRNIPDDKLKSVMGTREGGFFSFLTDSGTYKERDFEQDLVRVTAVYYDAGYINVKLSTPQVVLSPDKRYLYITIHIQEGKKYRIGKLDVRGDLLWKKEELLKAFKTKPGQIFNRSRLGMDVRKLTDRYKNRGYAYANLTPLTSIDANKRIVDLTLEIEKGPVVIFERINIRGNAKTRDKVIRREMKVSEGDRYSQALLDRSRARVTQLGFFESVNVTTRRGTTDDRIIVNFEIKERPTGTFQIGAGFSSVENFIAQAQISQNNLFGRGQRLSLQAQISGLRQLFTLSFQEPYFLDSRWTFGFDVYNSMRNFDSFNRNATGGQLVWGYPITDDIRVFLTYKGELVDVSTRSRGGFFNAGLASPLPSGVQLANLFDDGFTSSARFSVQWDRRNNRLFPTKGFFQAAWAEFSTDLLGSQNIFNKYGAFSRWYYPVWGPFVFKLNAQVGWITSSNPQGVPIFERFFVGGILDVRGFRPRSLGPKMPVLNSLDPNETVYYGFNKGGNKQLIFNAEIEFPIFEKVGIRGVVFTDAGNAFGDEQNLSFEGLRHSAGWGFRWFSPIGPLRFEWGMPLAPQPGEDAVVFEFTIGNFF